MVVLGGTKMLHLKRKNHNQMNPGDRVQLQNKSKRRRKITTYLGANHQLLQRKALPQMCGVLQLKKEYPQKNHGV
jgi:hypothetical protein